MSQVSFIIYKLNNNVRHIVFKFIMSMSFCNNIHFTLWTAMKVMKLMFNYYERQPKNVGLQSKLYFQLEII